MGCDFSDKLVEVGCPGRGMGHIATLTRPRGRGGTLSHRMGEGWGEGKRVAHPADHSVM